MKASPEKIAELRSNDVFVFGSNGMGAHSAGAALAALQKFGAVFGQPYGLQGQSFGINTMDGIEKMEMHISKFIDFATRHPDLNFLVTEIGCGIAGYSPEEIAPMFAPAVNLENVYLPQSFIDILTPHPKGNEV